MLRFAYKKTNQSDNWLVFFMKYLKINYIIYNINIIFIYNNITDNLV